MKKLKVNEIFHSIQGEGVYPGLNSVFLRLSECNLRCVYCDSQYHWQKVEYTVKSVLQRILEYPSHSVVITGGEPLLQQEALSVLCQKLRDREKYIIIETNGTIVPQNKLLAVVNHWSVSPKLVSSGNDIDKRLNYDALEKLRDNGCIFKFVVSDEKDLAEVKKLQDQLKIESRQIYLMKEGATTESQYKDIKPFINDCINMGYNFSPRLHVMIWDNQRGV